MAGTPAGGRKAKLTNLARYGEDFYRNMGRKGGRTPTTKPKGFAANRELARIAGAKAGRISKRGYKFLCQEEGFRKYLDEKTGKVVQFPV